MKNLITYFLIFISLKLYAQRADIIFDQKIFSNSRQIIVDYNSINSIDNWSKRSGINGSEFKTINYVLSLFTTNNGNPFYNKKGFICIIVRGISNENITISRDSTLLLSDNSSNIQSNGLNNITIPGGTDIFIKGLKINNLSISGTGNYVFESINASNISKTNMSYCTFNNCYLINAVCTVTGINDIYFNGGTSPNINCSTAGSNIFIRDTEAGGSLILNGCTYQLINAKYNENSSSINGIHVNKTIWFPTIGIKQDLSTTTGQQYGLVLNNGILSKQLLSTGSGNALTGTNNTISFFDGNGNINGTSNLKYNGKRIGLGLANTNALAQLHIKQIDNDTPSVWLDSRIKPNSNDGIVSIFNTSEGTGSNGDVTFFKFVNKPTTASIGDGITIFYALKDANTNSELQSARDMVYLANTDVNDITKFSATRRFYVTHNLSERLAFEIAGNSIPGQGQVRTHSIKHFNYIVNTDTDGLWKTDGNTITIPTLTDSIKNRIGFNYLPMSFSSDKIINGNAYKFTYSGKGFSIINNYSSNNSATEILKLNSNSDNIIQDGIVFNHTKFTGNIVNTFRSIVGNLTFWDINGGIVPPMPVQKEGFNENYTISDPNNKTIIYSKKLIINDVLKEVQSTDITGKAIFNFGISIGDQNLADNSAYNNSVAFQISDNTRGMSYSYMTNTQINSYITALKAATNKPNNVELVSSELNCKVIFTNITGTSVVAYPEMPVSSETVFLDFVTKIGGAANLRMGTKIRITTIGTTFTTLGEYTLGMNNAGTARAWIKISQ